jgi:hypothetical protein
MGHPQKPLKQGDPQPLATHGNRSSPSEGSAKDPQKRFLAQFDLFRAQCAVGMEPLMEPGR